MGVPVSPSDAVALGVDALLAAGFAFRKVAGLAAAGLLLLAFAIFVILGLGAGGLASIDPKVGLDPYAIIGIAIVGVGLFAGAFRAKGPDTRLKAYSAAVFCLCVLLLIFAGALLAGQWAFAQMVFHATGILFVLLLAVLIVAAVWEFMDKRWRRKA